MNVFAILIVLVASLLGQACTSPVAPTAAGPPSVKGGVEVQRPQPGKWESLTEAGKKEGRVVVYTSANPATRTAIAGAFKEKYGIDLEFVTGIGAELVTKLLTENRAGITQADLIIIGADDLISRVKPTGALEPLAPSLVLPEVLEEKAWQGGKLPLIDAEGQILGFLFVYTVAVLVNTNQVKEGQLKSYNDLLRPEWKGKILMADPTVPGGANLWMTYMVQNVLGEEKAREYARRLIQQDLVISRDSRLLVEWVAREKYPLLLGPHRQVVAELQAAGAPIEYRRMAEGGLVQASGGSISVVKARPHPKASAVFLNWLLSKEAQTIFAKNYGAPSARVDVTTEGQDPTAIPMPGEKIFIANEEWYIKKAQLVPALREIFQSVIR